MISWWRLWPLLIMPFFLYLIIGIIMEPLVLFGDVISITNYSAIFREWSVNTFVISILPVADSNKLVDWYMNTDVLGEMLVHFIVSLNIEAVLLPFIYLVGNWIIKVKTIFHVGELDDLRQQVKKH